MGLEGVFVRNLVEECRDGVLLCKVIEKIATGSIDWKIVRDPPKNEFDRNNNNNLAIKTMHAAFGKKTKLVGIGGVDITKGERTLVLATVWQAIGRGMPASRC